MAKPVQSAARLQELSRILSSAKSRTPKLTQPPKPSSSQSPTNDHQRTPLAAVVADCAKRWFHETLKEAKAGDAAMQVLVGQMYYSGYGVSRNPKKGHAWISRVSRIRSSVWKVTEQVIQIHVNRRSKTNPVINLQNRLLDLNKGHYSILIYTA